MVPYRNRPLGKVLKALSIVCLAAGLYFFIGPMIHNLPPVTPWFPLFMFLYFVLIVVGNILDKEEINFSDNHKYNLLYLRAFDNDNFFNNHETLLARQFHANINKFCIGKPGEKFETLGFTRIYLNPVGDSWKTEVSRLIEEADIIFFYYNKSAGANWEVGELIKQKALNKTLLYFPYNKKVKTYNFYCSLKAELEKYSINLPVIDENKFNQTQLISFDGANKAAVIAYQNKYLGFFDKLPLIKLSNVATTLSFYLKLRPYLVRYKSSPSFIAYFFMGFQVLVWLIIIVLLTGIVFNLVTK